MAFEVVCCLGLTDAQTSNHLIPIARHPLVTRLWIIRSRRSQHAEIPNSEYVLTSAKFKPQRWMQMMHHCNRLARRKEVRAFVSFNPIPYGFIANRAARRHGKAMHYGFIGSDWYKHATGKLGHWLRPALQKASFFTTTGPAMRDDLIEHGFDPEKIVALPHCVDLDRYTVADSDQARYSCVFVGQLIRLKRVDLILRAFARVVKTHPTAKLCIVGDGPLRSELEALAVSLGIGHAVDFVGYVQDVQPYLADSRMIVIASDHEGFPFALVEGICCGLVPISTPVGTIPDFVCDGDNGLLFPHGDDAALAQCIGRLLDDDQLYQGIRRKTVEMRAQFSYDRATDVWDGWLRSLG